MTGIYVLKIALAVGWRVDWREISIDAKTLVLQERVDSGLIWTWAVTMDVKGSE